MSPRSMRLIGIAIALGGAAWVLKFSLAMGAQGDAQLQPICSALWLAGFVLPLAVALSLTLYFVGGASRVTRASTFVLFAAAMLFVAGITLVSGDAFARALLFGAPRYLTAELPVLALGLTGLALAPLFWMEHSVARSR